MHWEIEIWTCPDFYFYLENKKSGRVQIFNFSLRKKKFGLVQILIFLLKIRIFGEVWFFTKFLIKKFLTKFFDQNFFDQNFVEIFFVQFFYFWRKNSNLDKSRFFFLKEKLKIWTCPDLSFSKQKKNLDFASNNTFNDGWVQIWNFQLKIKNPDTSEFFIFKVKIKIWTRPDFYFLMQKFKSGLGDM